MWQDKAIKEYWGKNPVSEKRKICLRKDVTD